MSRAYFHSLHGEACIAGREHGHLTELAGRFGVATIGTWTPEKAERIRSLIHPASHRSAGPASDPAWRRALAESMALGAFGIALYWRGTTFFAARLVDNSALHHGNDQVQLAVRLSRQCESHIWVDGPNRMWLAAIMQVGLDSGAYRRHQGWPEVIELLRARDDEPVVTSSSLNLLFPNATVCPQPAMPDGWVPPHYTAETFAAEHPDTAEALAEYWEEEVTDQFRRLPEDEQWRRAMAGLRADPWLELTPDRWGAGYWFRHGLALEDLLADDYADRLDAALTGYTGDDEEPAS